jgi:hypothetical protein
MAATADRPEACLRLGPAPARPLTATLALVIAAALAASCGPAPSDDAVALGDDTSTRSAGASTEPTTPQAADDGGPVAGDGDRSLTYEPGIDELAFTAGAWPTSGVPTTTAAPTPSTSASPSTTSGSGGSPVTTTGGGGGGDVSIYHGVVGSLSRDEPVVPAVVAPPAALPGTFPLTGLPGTPPTHPAAVVKIDNGSKARPQSGLDVADIVVEEEVEGGITRFAAIFHSTGAIVGPVRSARTTDIGIINGLGSPLLLYSGANQVTDALILAQPTVQNRNAGRSSGYWRDRSRRAPSNLYSDTGPHWASARSGPPPPQFAYRADGDPVPGVPDDALTVSYRASKAAWTWDGSAWLRSQAGRAHTAASGARISAANVVVIETRQVATGMVDSSGATVPEFVFVGTGKATVFTAGHRIEGVWTRPTLASVATLTTPEGAVIELTPGRTWIELIRADSGILG